MFFRITFPLFDSVVSGVLHFYVSQAIVCFKRGEFKRQNIGHKHSRSHVVTIPFQLSPL